MATINKYRRGKLLKRVFEAFRRRWVVFKLHFIRSAGIGRTTAAHGIEGFLSLVASAVHMLGKKVWGLLQAIFSFAAGKLHIYLEPVAEVLAGVTSHIKMGYAILGSRRHERRRLIPIMMLVTVTVAIYTLSFLAVGLKVEINGVSVGFVSSKGEMEEILAQVEDRISEYIGAPYSLELDVKYSIGYSMGSRDVDSEYISSYVMSSLDNVTAKYVLMVDGQPVGANRSRTALELLRQRMLELNSYDYRGGKLEFVQDVQVVPMGSMEAPELSIDEIQAKLTGNVKDSVIYVVQPGDTVSGIAQKYSSSVSEILSLNPGLEPNKIRAGDEVTVSASMPMLSVKETVREVYTNRIAYDTEKTTTDDLYTTQSRVKRSGVYGEAQVTADVVYVNGKEESRVVMDWQVMKEPVSEIIEVGTKKPPAKSATGTFRKPSNGVYSSGYGYRKNLGDFHTGVDFAGAVGTAIYAADGGKVSFAGWKGNYGYCVFIDHQNGYVTVYAHCSKLLVKAGQSVAKGETIARVGATGRVTGPHVHFEIRVNGKHTNPLNYISK